MAAISGTLSNNTPSASFTPTEKVSDVVVTNREGASSIVVEAKAANTDWEFVTVEEGKFSIPTTDPAILYRIRATGETVDSDYYMGP